MSDERSADRRPDIVAGAKVLPLVPRNIDEVLRYARMVMLAGAVPDSLAKVNGVKLAENEIVARVVSVIAAGSEVGMGPMSAMANIALINQRRQIWGQGAVGLLQQSGQLEDMIIEQIGPPPGNSTPTAQFHDDFGIRVTLKRKGRTTPYVGEYTVGKAKRAHLWMNVKKTPWIESPERQLQWRAFHIAASDGFSDCLNGMVVREVADDLLVPPPRITDKSFLDTPPRTISAPAETAESTDTAERAEPTESTVPGERAANQESTVGEERAVTSESTEVAERAGTGESTEEDERADCDESTASAERAGTGESTEEQELEDPFGLPPLRNPMPGMAPSPQRELPDPGPPSPASPPEDIPSTPVPPAGALAELAPRRRSGRGGGFDWDGYAARMIEGIAQSTDPTELRGARQSRFLGLLRSANKQRWGEVMQALRNREDSLAEGKNE